MQTQVIINPRTCKGRPRRFTERLRQLLALEQRAITWTDFPGHATELARDACMHACDTIVAVGGDGTINEVVNGCIGHDVAVGLIPTGTANDLANYHDIPTDLRSACQVIGRRHIRRVDAISVNGWCFLTVAGFGLPCCAVEEAESIRKAGVAGELVARVFGSKLYLLALALIYRRSTRRGIPLTLHGNQSDWKGEAYSVIIANQPFLGGRFQVAPAASNCDGHLDLFAITDNHDRHSLLQSVLSTVTGANNCSGNVVRLRESSLSIRSSEPMLLFGDGQVHERGYAFEFRVLPSAVNLIVPASFGRAQ